MNIKAFAKINLALKVLNQRDDGYHNIESILLPLEMHDVIEIKIDNLAADDFVTCDDFCLKTVKYNLCHKVIDEARKKRGFTKKLRISIHKNIFIQAGLGGGSADAAATLIGIIKLFKINPTKEELIDLSIKIGSDVPWSLFSQPAIIEQKGEKIDFINFKQQYHCLLVKPSIGLSTKEVFDKFDEMVAKLQDVTGGAFGTQWAPRIAETIAKYLGKGKKISECTPDQVDAVELISEDIIGASSYDDTGAFPGKSTDDLSLFLIDFHIKGRHIGCCTDEIRITHGSHTVCRDE